MKKRYYITTPLYYVNASPHIGHSYTQIACDAISRFLKQTGSDVFFMTGTDEHGEKIEKAALQGGYAKGKEKEFVDSILPRFKDLWRRLNIDYDFFIRTTDRVHEKTVRHVLSILHKKGDIYKKVYKGWFCTPCEMFWSHIQAPAGLCPDCKRVLEKLDEENYFFSMSKYQGKLIASIEEGTIKVKPQMRRNEVLSFLKGNKLQDLCISRPKKRLGWGIELPFDKEFIAYVWVDALINYISGIGYPGGKKFKALWPADLHVIGKDILRHHAIYWPILLFAIGVKPPRKIFAHGWWVVGKEKMSKSKGNIVDPLYLIDEKKYPVDALRYFLLSQVPFGWDGSFSERLFIEKYNSDLANDLGNLLNRTLTMVEKYFGSVTPALVTSAPAHQSTSKEERKLREGIRKKADKLPRDIEGFMDIEKDGPDFQGALKSILELVNKANKYIEVSAPWKHAKDNDIGILAIIMHTLIQVLGIVAVLLYPFMPDTARNMWSQIGVKKDITNLKYKGIKWGVVKTGTKINKGMPLFPRIKR